MNQHTKVETQHLRRGAYLYVRQSTLRQVIEHAESTKRQYSLTQRALALGWAPEQVHVVDCDQGQSGAATDRDGFQHLVAEVGLGRAGIVMGLEVSRLARNSTDWHRLLEICALTGTLILDEDGIYDPAHYNDRLLLGLKGTMSEAELHIMRARLHGGIRAKARRGEFQGPLPIGFVYDAEGRTVLDPDRQVQQALRHFFQTYRRTGSATATVRALRKEGVLIPRKARGGPNRGETLWVELTHSRAIWLLHNLRYAGVYFFGSTRQRRSPGGRTYSQRLPREEWIAFLPGAHEGYITLEQFDENQQRLRENARAYGSTRKAGPPREGPALLQGLVVCGKCGRRMTVRYHSRKQDLVPDYVCQRRGIERGEPRCQSVYGFSLDEAVGRLLVEMVAPLTLEVALAVQEELQARTGEVNRLRWQQVERVQYECDLARRRFMQVDPENRMVADTLEGEWNARLRALEQAREEHERQKEQGYLVVGEKQQAAILSLSTDFPRLWNDPGTPVRERKRMLRLLVEDVTLIKDKTITAHVRFRGGTSNTLTLPPPPQLCEMNRTPPEVIREIDMLLDHHTCFEIATILNDRGLRSGEGKQFHPDLVRRIRGDHGLKSRFERLREAGMLTKTEVAERLGVTPRTANVWRQHGLLRAHKYHEQGFLYEHPGPDAPRPNTHKGIQDRPQKSANPIDTVERGAV